MFWFYFWGVKSSDSLKSQSEYFLRLFTSFLFSCYQDDDLTLRVIGKPENQGLQFNFLTSPTKTNSAFEVLKEAEGSLLVSGVLQRGRAGSLPRG